VVQLLPSENILTSIPSAVSYLIFLLTKAGKIYVSIDYAFRFLNQFFATDCTWPIPKIAITDRKMLCNDSFGLELITQCYQCYQYHSQYGCKIKNHVEAGQSSSFGRGSVTQHALGA
jgi:hypothetical protein